MGGAVSRTSGGGAAAAAAAQHGAGSETHPVAAGVPCLEQSLHELEAGPEFGEPGTAATAAGVASMAPSVPGARGAEPTPHAAAPAAPSIAMLPASPVGSEPTTVELSTTRSAPVLVDPSSMQRRRAMKAQDSTRWKPRLPHEASHVFSRDEEFDTAEKGVAVELTENAKSTIAVSSLAYLVKHLQNDEFERMSTQHGSILSRWLSHVKEGFYNIMSAFWVHFVTTFHTESIFVVLNACFVTVLYGTIWKDTQVRLDLGIMTTAVIFPLSFLLQQSFQRREAALNSLSLLRSSITTTAMVTFSCDWPCKGGPSCGGRMQMPADFNLTAYHNFKALVYLTYEYLSMPTVGYARHRVIPSQRRETKRVHAAQNDILKRVAVKLGDIAMHTEVMKKHGFPATEASRIVNFVATVSDRFELLKVVKYYRTPQATRAFGRVYVLLLPWFMGPYTAFVAISTGLAFSVALSAFSMIVFLGLMNSQISLEDPYTEDGYDHIKLRYEIACCLQGLEIHFRRAESVRLANRLPLEARDAADKLAKDSSPNAGTNVDKVKDV